MRRHLDREAMEVMFFQERIWVDERIDNLQVLVMSELDKIINRLQNEWGEGRELIETVQKSKKPQTEGIIISDNGRKRHFLRFGR